MNEHARASELMVWKVNGRIESVDARWLDEHLERLRRMPRRAQGRAARARRHRPRADGGIRAAGVLQSPLGADRVGAARARARRCAGGGRARHVPVAARSRGARWLRVAVAAQAAVILVLCAVLWERPLAPAFRTVTDASPGPIAAGGVIKAIFADQVRLADVKEILQGAGLVVVSGPSEAGVYTLGRGMRPRRRSRRKWRRGCAPIHACASPRSARSRSSRSRSCPASAHSCRWRCSR